MSKYYIYIIITAFGSAVSQILLNLSNKRVYKNRIQEYVNPYVIGSYGILAVVLLANTYIMHYIPLKIAHALAASTYIFVLILSGFILKEKITLKKIAGNLLIIVGILVFIS